MSEWIKCSERMPDLNQMVTAYSPRYRGAMPKVQYMGDVGWWDTSEIGWHDVDAITHWIPEPPKEDWYDRA